jgi:hypothetical protein
MRQRLPGQAQIRRPGVDLAGFANKLHNPGMTKRFALLRMIGCISTVRDGTVSSYILRRRRSGLSHVPAIAAGPLG